MVTIAARVTRLERFRKCRDERDEEKREEYFAGFVEELKNPRAASWQMQMGTAFHAILGNPPAYQLPSDDGGCYLCDGFIFPAHVIRDSIASLRKDAMFEVPGYKIYHTPSAELIVTGTCDYLLGTEIGEFKTRWFTGAEWGVWDENMLRDQYENSFQHKLYMDLFGANTVRYTVFVMREKPTVQLIRIKSDIVCERYPQMTEEIQELCADYTAFILDQNLITYSLPGTREKDFVQSFPF